MTTTATASGALFTSPEAWERFDTLCRQVSKRDRGVTLQQLGDARALAVEEDKPEPDPRRVTFFRRRLGLDSDEEDT